MNVTFEFAGQRVSAYWNEKTYANGSRYVDVKRGYQSARGTYNANENAWSKRVGSPAYDAAIEAAFGWTHVVAPEPEIQEDVAVVAPVVEEMESEKAMEKMMAWNQDTQSYRGVTSDGQIVDVSADEYSDALDAGLKADAAQRGYDFDALTDEQRKACENATYEQIDDPNTWTSLVCDNQNAEFVHA